MKAKTKARIARLEKDLLEAQSQQAHSCLKETRAIHKVEREEILRLLAKAYEIVASSVCPSEPEPEAPKPPEVAYPTGISEDMFFDEMLTCLEKHYTKESMLVDIPGVFEAVRDFMWDDLIKDIRMDMEERGPGGEE